MFGYRIGKGVRIGVSLIDCPRVEIGDDAIIGHLNRFKDVPSVSLGDHCTIGHSNVFVASSEFTDPRSLSSRGNRPLLQVGRHAGISKSHHFDVNDELIIGEFTTIAGAASQFFTHYVDVRKGTQATKPLHVGRYCMIGSGARLVPGASVADCCVVAMGAVVTKSWSETHVVLGGNPARVVSTLPPDAPYFHRTTGWISEFVDPPFARPGDV